MINRNLNTGLKAPTMTKFTKTCETIGTHERVFDIFGTTMDVTYFRARYAQLPEKQIGECAAAHSEVELVGKLLIFIAVRLQLLCEKTRRPQ